MFNIAKGLEISKVLQQIHPRQRPAGVEQCRYSSVQVTIGQNRSQTMDNIYQYVRFKEERRLMRMRWLQIKKVDRARWQWNQMAMEPANRLSHDQLESPAYSIQLAPLGHV